MQLPLQEHKRFWKATRFSNFWLACRATNESRCRSSITSIAPIIAIYGPFGFFMHASNAVEDLIFISVTENWPSTLRQPFEKALKEECSFREGLAMEQSLDVVSIEVTIGDFHGEWHCTHTLYAGTVSKAVPLAKHMVRVFTFRFH